MTRLESFAFGIILVGFCGALAIADEPRAIECKTGATITGPPFSSIMSAHDNGDGTMTACFGHSIAIANEPLPQITPGTILPQPVPLPLDITGQVLVVDPATGEERWTDLNRLCAARDALKSRSFK